MRTQTPLATSLLLAVGLFFMLIASVTPAHAPPERPPNMPARRTAALG